jgi:hypothetical protein
MVPDAQNEARKPLLLSSKVTVAREQRCRRSHWRVGWRKADLSPCFDRSGYDLPLDGGGFPNGGSKGGVLSLDIHGGAWRT